MQRSHLFSILIICALIISEFAYKAPGFVTPGYACSTWANGERVGLRGGSEIRHGSGLGYQVHTIVPEDNWQVDIIDGPRYADGYTWWDISRKKLDGGGTGWVYIEQAGWDVCSNEPPSAPPGQLSLLDDLGMWSDGSGQWPPRVGDKVVAHIKVKNTGGQELTLNNIGVRGRRNGGEFWDIGWWQVTLQPGEVWELNPNNERPLQDGNYSFRISYQVGSDWREIGNEINFTAQVNEQSEESPPQPPSNPPSNPSSDQPSNPSSDPQPPGSNPTSSNVDPSQADACPGIVKKPIAGFNSAPTGRYVYVPADIDKLRLRKSHSTNACSYGWLTPQDYYSVIKERNDGWIQIETKVSQGWIMGQYVELGTKNDDTPSPSITDSSDESVSSPPSTDPDQLQTPTVPIVKLGRGCEENENETVTCKALGVTYSCFLWIFCRDPYIGVFEVPSDAKTQDFTIEFKKKDGNLLLGTSTCGGVISFIDATSRKEYTANDGFQLVQGCVHKIELAITSARTNNANWTLTYPK